MALRVFLVAALGVVALAGATTRASSQPEAARATASSSSYGIQVIVPGAGGSAAAASAPPDSVSAGGAFAYPADGSGARAGNVAASAFASGGVTATASAAGEVSGLSLFGGEITASSIVAKVRASGRPGAASGDFSGSAVNGLVALGQAVPSAPGASAALADWGTLTVLSQSTSHTVDSGARGVELSVLALQVTLTAEHGGLPAGSVIQVGYAETSVKGTPPRAAPPPRKRAELAPAAGGTPQVGQPREPGESRFFTPTPLRKAPPSVTPPLTPGRYVFPVFGPSSWTDTWGSPRAAPVGWHHGQDIFAPLGSPLLAVTDGTLFSVGWNDLGGNRLWLRDRGGNEYYYAHLSAFSTRAVDGAEVKAGDVIGFVGTSGDAAGTPPHVHFEIHPVSLLFRKYDGAVNPAPYLTAWSRLVDVPFTSLAGWALPFASSSRVPKPGAILLQASDIANASGLDPGSLLRALRARPTDLADGALANPRQQVPLLRRG